MTVKNIKIKSKNIGLHKAICNPNWGAKTVITDDCFLYVELFIQRCRTLKNTEKERALACWNQAQSFYNAINNLSILSKPLLAYYSMLNAARALLILKNKLPKKEIHGVSGQQEGNACLSNELIKIKESGILPSLSEYYGEKEKRDEFTLKDLLYNLPYVHRAYTLSYRSSTELFIPIKKGLYVHKKDDYGNEGWLNIELDNKYNNKTFIKTVPACFEKDVSKSERFILRTTNRVKFKKNEKIDSQIQRISAKHRNYRESLFYIASNQRLWYLKRNVETEKIINMYSPTITFAVMHRLSELSRYAPERLEHILKTQMGWVVTEFIKLAPYQFIDEISAEITGQEIMPPMVRG